MIDENVPTDDHSPMREMIARVLSKQSLFFLVLAFAPTSYYEFNKGEAQNRRLLPINLPILEPRVARTSYKEIGNLVWWMGRGRLGIMNRINDYLTKNLEDLNSVGKKELADSNKVLGTIGGTRIIENMELIYSIGEFSIFRKSLFNMFPTEKGQELNLNSGVKAIESCNLVERTREELIQIIEKVLQELQIEDYVQIAYYIFMVFDGLSDGENHFPVFVDQTTIKEIIGISEEIFLDFEGEQSVPNKSFRELKNKVSMFSVKLYNEMIGREVHNAYIIHPGLVHSLFPFPTSSPNLNPDVKIEEQREALGAESYLGKAEVDDVEVVFFLNNTKMSEFFERKIVGYLNESSTLLSINLGNKGDSNLSTLPTWLHEQGRLQISNPTESLSDFLISFFYWVKTNVPSTLPVNDVLDLIRSKSISTDKDILRKLQNYSTKTLEFIKSEKPIPTVRKFSLNDKTDFEKIRTGRVGFSSEIVGFAFAAKYDDILFFNSIKDILSKSLRIKNSLSEKNTGVTTAVETMVVGRKTPSLGSSLKRIAEAFDKQSIENLRPIAEVLTPHDFISIPADKDLEVVFNGIFLYLQEWKDNTDSDSELNGKMSIFKTIIKRIATMESDISDFGKKTHGYLQLIFPLSNDRASLEEIETTLSKYRPKLTPYSKFLFSKYLEKICETLEFILSGYEKNKIQILETLNNTLIRFNEALQQIQDFDRSTFTLLEVKSDQLNSEYLQRFKEACRSIPQSGNMHLDSQPEYGNFLDEVDDILMELDKLKEFDESVIKVIEIAIETNKHLNKLR